MSDDLEKYMGLLTQLRERRRRPEWVSEEDRGLLADLEDFYATLTPAEQALVEEEGWRAWPDMYDKKMGR